MSIRKGVKGALPIMLGYVPVGIAFGIISADGASDFNRPFGFDQWGEVGVQAMVFQKRHHQVF